jgi:hypothetical protein
MSNFQLSDWATLKLRYADFNIKEMSKHLLIIAAVVVALLQTGCTDYAMQSPPCGF